jgi:hypothetical protein
MDANTLEPLMRSARTIELKHVLSACLTYMSGVLQLWNALEFYAL